MPVLSGDAAVDGRSAREHSIRRKLDDFDAIIALRNALHPSDGGSVPRKEGEGPAGIGGIGEMMKALDDAIGTGRRL